MTAERREWDLIVVGLGALGSGAAYWASTHPGARVLGLEQFESGPCQRRVGRTTAGSSGSPTTGPTTSGSRSAPTRPGRRSRPKPATRIVTVTGGLDLWPADPAIPKADYTDSLTAEARPVRAARRRRGDAPLAAVAARRGHHRRCSRRRAAWPTRSRATRRTAAWPQAHGATLLDRTPVTAHPRRRRARWSSSPAASTHRARTVVVAADAWTNELLASFGRRLPLTITKEQVTYFAARGPGGLRAGPLPRLDLDGRAVLLRLPDLRRGRPEGRPGLSAAARRRPQTRTFERRPRLRMPGCDAFLAPHLPGAVGPGPLHEDLPVHAHPGPRLRRRPRARGTRRAGGRSAPPTPSSSPRCSAGSWPSWALDGDDAIGAASSRRFAIDRPILLEEAPATSWMV